MSFDDLTPEQLEKARACATPEELLELAKQEGFELTDEQLESVAGGVVIGPGGGRAWGEIDPA